MAHSETAIVRNLIRFLAKHGWHAVAVNNGEETIRTTTEKQVIDEAFSVDVSRILFQKEKNRHWVAVLAGEGEDVIADYSYSEADADGFGALMDRWFDEYMMRLNPPRGAASMTKRPRNPDEAGIEKSRGHIAFIGGYEYFATPDGDVWRAPIEHYIETAGEWKGYRSGHRFFSTAAGAELGLKLAREAAKKFGANPDVFVVGNPGVPIGKSVHKVYYEHVTEGNRVHEFEVRGVKMEGLPDGSIRIYHPRHRLWDDL